MYRQDNLYQSPLYKSPRQHSSSSKSTNMNHSTIELITSISQQQHKKLTQMSRQYMTIQQSITSIENMCTSLSERIHRLNSSRQTQVLGSLKIKQNEFIINELKNTISKSNKKQQKLIYQLECEKKKVQKFKEQSYKMQSKNSSLTQQLYKLQRYSKQKVAQIDQLNISLAKANSQIEKQSKNTKTSQLTNNLQRSRSAQQYGELQQRLQQLQKSFSTQIQKLVNKNEDLLKQIKDLQRNSQQQSKNFLKIQKQNTDLSKAKYELQMRLKHQTSMFRQLQQSYNQLVQKSSSDQILLHKQLQQHKIREQENKNEYKKQKKLFKNYLNVIAQYINGGKYYLSGNSIQQLVEDIKKLFEKCCNKKIQNLNRELNYYQAESNKEKQKVKQLLKKNEDLQKRQIVKSQQASFQGVFQTKVQKQLQIQKSSDHQNNFNKSINKSEQDRSSTVEERYKSKLQALRRDSKSKAQKINQLQKQQQEDFDKTKEKILALEQQIAEKINQIRKWQLKIKQKDYQLLEYQSKIKQVQSKMQSQNQRFKTQKQSNNKLFQMKTASYQEKVKQLKTNYRELERRQQQKTVKYNKLKTKYQKYDIEVGQTIKRKNVQIDQLLKENNKLKTENKILQEKIKIDEIIRNEVINNKTLQGNTVKSDLIQQIQMERDRIAMQLSQQLKKNVELSKINTHITSEMMSAKKQQRQLRYKTQQLQKSEKLLIQQNKIIKQKLQVIKQQRRKGAQQGYLLIKKQLQKSVISCKKTQRALQKISNQKQQLKTDVQHKEKEVLSLKYQIQSLKTKLDKSNTQVDKLKDRQKQEAISFQRKISQFATKEEQLINIINYKNRIGDDLRDSMKGQELFTQKQKTVKYDKESMTDKIQYADQAINTQPNTQNPTNNSRRNSVKPIVPSELFLDQLQLEIKQENVFEPQVRQKIQIRSDPINFFGELVNQNENMDENFQICDQQQEINIGQTALNIQLRQIFNALRKQIQKIINEDQFSISIIKVLPRQLEDDFNQLISFIKQKIVEIKSDNNLTFIMAEGGNEPSIADISDDIQIFLAKETVQTTKLRKIIEEKDSMITGLMNQKTQQENTITQHQQMQEETQRLHMQQYNVLKSEIVNQKQSMDKQQLYYESLKNVFKKMINFWIDDEDNFDDFRDNLMLFSSIYQFSKKEEGLLKLYLQKYKQLKHIQ